MVASHQGLSLAPCEEARLEEGRMMPKSSMCSNSCFAAWRHSGRSIRLEIKKKEGREVRVTLRQQPSGSECRSTDELHSQTCWG